MISMKRIFLPGILVFLAVMLTACSPAGIEKPDWTVTVAGADKAEFTSADYSKLDPVTIEASMKGEKQSWEGVLLKDVLNAVGAGDYTSVTLEGADGYKAEYALEVVNDSGTILGTKVGGEALGEQGGYVQSVAASQTPNTWVRSLIKITVNK